MLLKASARESTVGPFGVAIGCLLFQTACSGPADNPSLVPAANASSQAVPQPRGGLAPGHAITVDLAGGEHHAYRVPLDAGTFLRSTVTQLGLDLAVTLIGPGNERLIKFDKLTGKTEPEELLWVAEEAGDYQLEIIALNRAAAGRYELRVEDLRPANLIDRQRVAAEVLFAEGEKLRRRSEESSRREAVNQLQQAIGLWQSLNLPKRQTDGYYSLGLAYRNLDLASAIEAFENCLGLLEEHPNPWLRASTLHRLGHLHRRLGDPKRANHLYREALPWRRESGDLRGEAKTRNNLGVTYELLGEIPKALESYRLALEQWRGIGNPREEAIVLHNLGKTYFSAGLIEEAIDSLVSALTIRRELKDLRGQATTLSALGQARARLGDLKEAFEAHRRAFDLGRQAKDRHSEAAALVGMALMHDRLGRPQQALKPLDQALAIFRELGDLDNEANALHNVGWILEALGTGRSGVATYRQALAIYTATDNRHGKIMVHRSLSKALRKRGELTEAREHIETALAGIEHIRIKPHSTSLRYSYFATKQSYYETNIDLLMDLHRQQPKAGYAAEALTVSERARARSQLDALTESGADLRVGVDPRLRDRERALEKEIEAFELRRLGLVDSEGPETALSATERQLRDLFLEYRRVQGEIRIASPRYAALTQPRPLTADDIRRRVVDDSTLLLQYDLGEERSYLWAVTPDNITTYELPPRADIEKIARRTYKLLRSSHRTASRIQTRIALQKLSQHLLEPVADLLETRRVLIVADGALQTIPFSALPSPVQVLDEAPQSAEEARAQPFYGTTQPLGETHEIVNMPSASTLAVLRNQVRGRSQPLGTIAVVADPVFSLDDPRLALDASDSAAVSGPRGHTKPLPRRYERLIFSRKEAEDILTLAPSEDRFAAMGFNANRDVVLNDRFSQHRILHFATHGELNVAHPELSRLVLSQVDAHGQKQDGYVFAHEIYGLDLAAHLVVLSACETALGTDIRGEGLLGLPQSFMYAGAASVIVSLWNVDDQATAELMAHFYEKLLIAGLPPAAALRSAQMTIRKATKWQAPYFWAGFVLQGEWRSPIFLQPGKAGGKVTGI